MRRFIAALVAFLVVVPATHAMVVRPGTGDSAPAVCPADHLSLSLQLIDAEMANRNEVCRNNPIDNVDPLGLEAWGLWFEDVSKSTTREVGGWTGSIESPTGAGLLGFWSEWSARTLGIIGGLDIDYTSTRLAAKLIKANELQRTDSTISRDRAAYNAMQLTLNPMTPLVEGYDKTSYQPDDFGRHLNRGEAGERLAIGTAGTAGAIAYVGGTTLGTISSVQNLMTVHGTKYNTTPMLSQYAGEESGSVWGTRVRYLSAVEREQYAVTIKDGRLFNRTGQALDSTRLIYVMDEAGRIFVGPQAIGEFHHSSFLAGQAVAAAGEMSVANGVLRIITARSGHYRPTAAYLNQFLGELRRRGVDVTNVVVE